MKTFSENAQRKLCTVLAGGVALMLTSSFAMAAIADTRHNLGTSGTKVAGQNTFSGTAEICVFCHTPHGADTSAAVPLWNRALSNPNAFTRYSTLQTATFDAGEAPVGSVSIACLSCHDGTQAMNAVINTPGSGTTTTMTGSWTGNNVVNGSGGTSGRMTSPAGASFPNLGVDLRNDHPVGMQYAGGGIHNGSLTGSVPVTGTADADFAQGVNSASPTARSGAVIGQVGTRVLGSSLRVWWVETPGTGAGQQKADLTLYSRTDGTGSLNPGQNQPYVECATCHDPHSSNSTFLRIQNTGSAVCLACHDK